MKLTKVTVSYGRTYNTGNYQSMRLEYSAEATVDDGEKFSEVKDKLKEALYTQVESDALIFKARLKKDGLI